ncbi:unnamed protein product [Oppiella nova]|uniref:Uncharacterized protein n=1 Tax=Oppiella nova TaxID=334625 RepID=A0A7R9QDG2_9ACAR|nr:unnamed protein product [Oppiella nova]CAG2163605.1 unnamed protein product [Oppiella nova]
MNNKSKAELQENCENIGKLWLQIKRHMDQEVEKRYKLLRREFRILNDISVEVNPTHNSSVYRTPTVGLTEQNRFDNTVQKMANKMINISAHSEQLPQTMWRDRQKTYARKVLNIRSPLPLTSSVQKFTKSKSEPNNVTIQERCATIECIREEDLKLINKFSQMSSNAIKKGFSFWSEEPIVVEFNPNTKSK